MTKSDTRAPDFVFFVLNCRLLQWWPEVAMTLRAVALTAGRYDCYGLLQLLRRLW